MKMKRIAVAAVVTLALSALLTAAAPNGTFTIDDSNYLATLVALKSGSLSLPQASAYPASPEWYAFDPAPPLRGPPRIPVYPTAPPLWAPFALPFSFFGLAGLRFLNALAFALTALIVHRLTARFAKLTWTPHVAATLFAFGTFSLEYALGVWPHMFSVLAVAVACYAAMRAREADSAGWAAIAGAAAGVAAGVRYQNVVVAFAVGVALLAFSRRRVKVAGAFAAALAVPLFLSAWMNLHRLGVFHPATKGGAYGTASAVVVRDAAPTSWVPDVALSFWSRIVDYSVHPPIPLPSGDGRFWEADPDLGVFVTSGAVKKALLQSAPWVAFAWVVMLLAFRRGGEGDERQRTEMRAQAILAGAVVAAFSLAGTSSTDGLCFNARYFLELLPGAAVVVAWRVERAALGGLPRPAAFDSAQSASLAFDSAQAERVRRLVLVGAFGGLGLVALIGFAEPYSFLRSTLLRFAPLLLTAIVLAALVLEKRRPLIIPAVIAACAVWAFGSHVIDDLPASYRIRSHNAELLAEARQVVPRGSAIFVWSIERDALWPMWAFDDCLIIDLGKDGGRDGPMLARELLQRGRRVFVHEEAPRQVVGWLLNAGQLAPRSTGSKFTELVAR